MKRDPQHRIFPVNIAKFLRAIFFSRTPPVAASDSPTTVQQSQLGCLFFDFAPQVLPP